MTATVFCLLAAAIAVMALGGDGGATRRSVILGALVGAATGIALTGTAVAVLAVVGGASTGRLVARRRVTVRASVRRRSLEADLPDVAELLAAAVEGGVPTWRALAVVGACVPGALGTVLVSASRDVEDGTRSGAGDALLDRAPELPRLGALVRSADELGTPLAEELRLLALDERDRRVREVRLRAAAAGPRMMLVIGALLAPAALLLVVGGEVLSVADALRSLR